MSQDSSRNWFDGKTLDQSSAEKFKRSVEEAGIEVGKIYKSKKTGVFEGLPIKVTHIDDVNGWVSGLVSLFGRENQINSWIEELGEEIPEKAK